MKRIILFIAITFGVLTYCSTQSLSANVSSYGILENVNSESMERDLPVLVFLPSSYRASEKAFPVVYFLHGVSNIALTDPLLESKLKSIYNPKLKIKEVADFYDIIIVTPLVTDSYYLDAPNDSNIRFSTYVGEELPAYIDAKYRTIKNRKGRYLAGFSMGGYGAVSLLCRYPDSFSVALNRSGIMNLATGIEDLDWDDPIDNVNVILGDYWTNQEAWHKHSCFNLVNHIRHRDDIAIVIEVGVDDFLYKTNNQFKKRLDELGIPNIYSEYQGGHYFDANVFNSLIGQLQFFRKTRR